MFDSCAMNHIELAVFRAITRVLLKYRVPASSVDFDGFSAIGASGYTGNPPWPYQTGATIRIRSALLTRRAARRLAGATAELVGRARRAAEARGWRGDVAAFSEIA